ncbi:MAG: hypothetical protein GY906_21320 [bacterium]|nr:hypothetical protein [bacterium]
MKATLSDDTSRPIPNDDAGITSGSKSLIEYLKPQTVHLPTAWVFAVGLLSTVWIWSEVQGYSLGIAKHLTQYLWTNFALLCAAVLVRMATAAVQSRQPTAVKEVVDRHLVLDLLGAGFLMTITSAAYLFTKLMIPALNPTLWDATLAKIDRLLFFGLQPNFFITEIFQGNPKLLSTFIDAHYSFFILLTAIGTLWYSTDQSRSRRRRFIAALSLLWTTGCLLYLLIPALGPALVAEDLWLEVRNLFPNNAGTQRELMQNYAAVQSIIAGGNRPVTIEFGVAAMPSLHVAVHFLFWLWARRTNRIGAWLWGVVAALTAIGSVATGWHWAIDSVAGALLAYAIYRFALIGSKPELLWPAKKTE